MLDRGHNTDHFIKYQFTIGLFVKKIAVRAQTSFKILMLRSVPSCTSLVFHYTDFYKTCHIQSNVDASGTAGEHQSSTRLELVLLMLLNQLKKAHALFFWKFLFEDLHQRLTGTKRASEKLPRMVFKRGQEPRCWARIAGQVHHSTWILANS